MSEKLNPGLIDIFRKQIQKVSDPDSWGNGVLRTIESTDLSPTTKKSLGLRFLVYYHSATESPTNPSKAQEPLPPTNGNGHSQEPIAEKGVIFQNGLNSLTGPEKNKYLSRRDSRRLGHESGKDGRPKFLNRLRSV